VGPANSEQYTSKEDKSGPPGRGKWTLVIVFFDRRKARSRRGVRAVIIRGPEAIASFWPEAARNGRKGTCAERPAQIKTKGRRKVARTW